MLRDKLPARQLGAWLFAGTVPVLIQLLSGGSWIWIAIVGAVTGLTAVFIWQKGWQPAKWQCPILFIYVVVLLGRLLPEASQSWPVGNSYPAVPLILLLAAAWSAQKGLSASARVGTVLFWVVLIMYLVMFGAGLKDVHLPWLMPQWTIPEPLGLVVLLIPAGAACLLSNGGKAADKLLMPTVFTAAAAVITGGVLSPAVAATMSNAFYEMCRSINILGVARRLEALISAGMTVGWFSLMSLLLSMCGVVTQKLLRWGQKAGVWLGAGLAALIMLCGLHISGIFLLLAGTVFWVLFPLLPQGLGPEKKS